MADIFRPNTTVAKSNAVGTVYLIGDADTDGSVRFGLDAATQLIILSEKRIAGTWVPADIQHAIASWVIDDTTGELVLDDTGELVFEGSSP